MEGIEDGLAGIVEAFSSSERGSTPGVQALPQDGRRMTE
jgi:hypothetical protein